MRMSINLFSSHYDLLLDFLCVVRPVASPEVPAQPISLSDELFSSMSSLELGKRTFGG